MILCLRKFCCVVENADSPIYCSPQLPVYRQQPSLKTSGYTPLCRSTSGSYILSNKFQAYGSWPAEDTKKVESVIVGYLDGKYLGDLTGQQIVDRRQQIYFAFSKGIRAPFVDVFVESRIPIVRIDTVSDAATIEVFDPIRSMFHVLRRRTIENHIGESQFHHRIEIASLTVMVIRFSSMRRKGRLLIDGIQLHMRSTPRSIHRKR